MKLVVSHEPVKVPASQSSQLSLRNLGPATIWIGKSARVSPADGYPLYDGEAYEMPADVVKHGDLWVVTAVEGETADVRVLVVG
jgi:hypothetical protein